MDFPYSWTRSSGFVSALAEVKQTIYSILVNELHTFLQSEKLGSTVPLHTDDENLLEIGLKSSLSQINNLTYQRCEVEKKDTICNIKVYVQYYDTDLTISHSYTI